jgi:hypothetical protein
MASLGLEPATFLLVVYSLNYTTEDCSAKQFLYSVSSGNLPFANTDHKLTQWLVTTQAGWSESTLLGGHRKYTEMAVVCLEVALYSFNKSITEGLMHAATEPDGVSIVVAVNCSVWRARAVHTSRQQFVLYEAGEASVPSKNMCTRKCVRTSQY